MVVTWVFYLYIKPSIMFALQQLAHTQPPMIVISLELLYVSTIYNLAKIQQSINYVDEPYSMHTLVTSGIT